MRNIIILFSFLFLLTPLLSIPGGWTYPSPPNDPKELEDLTRSILIQLNWAADWKIANILSHQSQVVAGINHKLTVVLESKTGEKKVVFWKVFEGLGTAGMEIVENVEVLSANDHINNSLTELNATLNQNLQEKILKLHKYYTNMRIQFNFRKIRWGYSLTRNATKPIYYLLYELEGTNNEISLWEHWINMDENVEKINLVNNTLFIRKLPINKIRTNKFVFSDKCEEVKSLLFCAVDKSCNEQGFENDGLCKDKKN